jgi:hypothetical protein
MFPAWMGLDHGKHNLLRNAVILHACTPLSEAERRQLIQSSATATFLQGAQFIQQEKKKFKNNSYTI